MCAFIEDNPNKGGWDLFELVIIMLASFAIWLIANAPSSAHVYCLHHAQSYWKAVLIPMVVMMVVVMVVVMVRVVVLVAMVMVKERVRLPKRMNFPKKFKWPLTPPHFRKTILQLFPNKNCLKPCVMVQNLQYQFLD